MKDKNKFGIISLILGLVALIIPNIFAINNLTGEIILIIFFIIVAIVGVVLGFLGKKSSKGLSIAGIVIGIITTILLCLSLLGMLMFKNATNCVDNGNGTSTCELMGEPMPDVPTVYLTDEQMKKGE